MWKEAAVVLFETPFQHLPGGTKDNQENALKILLPDRDLNPGTPKQNW
jgi:hypothetical protein